jgi:Galactose oxidase, central domain
MILNFRRIGARVIANLIFFSVLLESTAIAQSPGTFIATGSMTVARFFHTATVLADGRVLIAGGQRLDPPPADFTNLSSAEIYDPGTGTFTATGSMTRTRSRHTATLLPNGQVLIAGGQATAAPNSTIPKRAPSPPQAT